MKTIWVIVALCLLLGAEAADAKVPQTVELGTADVTTFVPQDTTQGTYYVLKFDVPQDVTSEGFLSAVLEFRADVSAATVDGWQNDTPVVEVYILSSAATTGVAENQLRRPSGMIRNVVTGDDKQVRIDISEAVRYLLENPSNNYGLAVGSFRGGKEGRFTLKASTANSSLATVTFYCR